MRRILRCYAEGSKDGWEAYCLDLDIAIQANTLDEAIDSLHGAIELHLETVFALPEEERAPLLYRSAPLGLQLKFAWAMIRGLFRGRSPDGPRHSEGFTCPAPT